MNIPEGYKLVPIYPTYDMVSAVIDLWRIDPDDVDSIWSVMIENSPFICESNSSAYDEAKERELFELNHEVPDGVYFSKEKNEYRSMNMRGFEILVCEDLTTKFKGWLACAKSRARSAE